MNNLVIIEYLSVQNIKDLVDNKHNISEGIKMVDTLSNIFINEKSIKEISIIRNENIEIKKHKKINYFLTSKKKSWEEIIKNFIPKNCMVIIIAPETNRIYIKMFKTIKKLGFKILNSKIHTLKLLSSKYSTHNFLKKKKVMCTNAYKNFEKMKKNCKYIIKPEYGAGSENINLVDNFYKIKGLLKKINYPFLLQYLESNIVGSFSMLCLEGKNNLISCNKQIIEINKNKLKQTGIYVGKFEKFRNDFQLLANKISVNFKDLYGYIGVDVVLENNCWKVIEINPRFTSAVLGLKKAYGKKVLKRISDLYINQNLKIGYEPKIIKPHKITF